MESAGYVSCAVQAALLGLLVCVQIHTSQANPIWSFSSENLDSRPSRVHRSFNEPRMVRRNPPSPYSQMDGDRLRDLIVPLLQSGQSLNLSERNYLASAVKALLEKYSNNNQSSSQVQKREGPNGLDYMCIWKVCRRRR